MQVKALESGYDVFPALQEALKAGTPFDLCIIDIQMPGLSGYEVGKQIRALDPPISNTPLLAFSSSTVARTKKYRKPASMALYQTTPAAKLLRMVHQLLQKKKAPKIKKKINAIRWSPNIRSGRMPNMQFISYWRKIIPLTRSWSASCSPGRVTPGNRKQRSTSGRNVYHRPGRL